MVQITFNTTVKLTKTDEKTIRTILAGCKLTLFQFPAASSFFYPPDKLHNCDIMIREDVGPSLFH